MEDACGLSSFATCHAVVAGRLPATWAPSCSVTELFAYLQPVQDPAAFVHLKDEGRLRYRVSISRAAVRAPGHPSVQFYAGYQWTYVQAAVVNALARRERAHLQTVLPPMTAIAIRKHMESWGKSANNVLTALWDPSAPPLSPPQPVVDHAAVQGAGDPVGGPAAAAASSSAAAASGSELPHGVGGDSGGEEEEAEEVEVVEVVEGYGHDDFMQVRLIVMRGYAGWVPLLALTLPVYLSRWKWQRRRRRTRSTRRTRTTGSRRRRRGRSGARRMWGRRRCRRRRRVKWGMRSRLQLTWTRWRRSTRWRRLHPRRRQT